MEIIALCAAVLAAVVYVAEKIAFAAVVYMLCSWLWKVSTPVRRWAEAEYRWVAGKVAGWISAYEAWRRLRTLRRQFVLGATP